MTRLQLNYVAASDRGLVRGNNEDSAYAGPHLLLLADGMGGHAAGEVASQMMVEHMEHLDRDPGDADVLALLGAAADDANASIKSSIRNNPAQEGMGTTLTALMFNGVELGLIHVGDSRGYRLRDGELSQITVDDTFVQTLVEQGKINAEDVSSHPQKSLILKAYTGRPVKPHLELLDAVAGDRYLLCSDGLSDPVTHDTIESTLGEGSPEQAARRLIELALRSGGPDNVTVVVADVVDTDAPGSPDLPTASAMAGALAATEEPSHPDTAAGRAARLVKPSSAQRSSESPQRKKPADSRDSSFDEEENHRSQTRQARERTKRKSRAVPVVITLLVISLAAMGAYWWFDSARSETYFVALGKDDRFVIEQGFNSSFMGADLHKPVQQVCITHDNQITLVDNDAVPATCQPFSLSDLPQSVQSRVSSLSSGSYAEVSDQLNRLADEALPVCVESKKDQNPGAANADQRSADACREVR